MKLFDFGPLLGKTEVDEALCNDLLKIGEVKTEKFNKFLVGRIEKEMGYDYNDMLIFEPQISIYIKKYLKSIEDNRGKKIDDFELVLEKLWINFQKPGEYNPPHVHTGLLSFVIYLEISDEIERETNEGTGNPNGSITFAYGNRTAPKGIFNNNFIDFLQPTTNLNFLPKKCDMFIFPAYLEHYVESFYSTESKRISVSGRYNMVLKHKNKKSLI